MLVRFIQVVITGRHVAVLLDLNEQEGAAILMAAERVAEASVKTYSPLGVLTTARTDSTGGLLSIRRSTPSDGTDSLRVL